MPTAQQAQRAAITFDAYQKAEAVLLRQYSSLFPENILTTLLYCGECLYRNV